MRTLFTLLFICTLHSVFSQKEVRRYLLPEGIKKSDYSQTSVLVKWREIPTSSESTRQSFSAPGVGIASIKAMAPKHLITRNASFRGPYESVSKVDIQKYERIVLTPGQNIESVINALYKTGKFELVEPEFAHKMSFTPNDPSVANQYYLDLINAYEAWDVTQGSEEVVIAIIDSGADLDHPDLAANVYTNPDEIAGNSIDDDEDGYVDNVRGWDFVGGDTLNIYDASFIGDNDPNLKQAGTAGVLTHGVMVGGCAGGVANNNVGIAGVGYKSKLLFTKHTGDNQRLNSLSVFFGYDGILYAASTLAADNVSRKIINCSWGGSFRSQIAQDLINYVTLDLGCLVVGAAGNENTQTAHYPSGYDNVLSVAATNQSDLKASFSNYGYSVDICAPGVSILTTMYNNLYGTTDGTSFSCPIASGAAALIWAHRPQLSAVQLAELMRVSADESIYTKNSSIYKNKLGFGRLDVYNALTLISPSVKASNPKLVNLNGDPAEPGQSANLVIDFKNLLNPSTSGLTVTLSASSDITFTNNQAALGVLGSNQTTKRSFPIMINANALENMVVDVTLEFTDGQYKDSQVISFNVNPSFLDIDENRITTTVSSRGRIGFDDPDNQAKGNGFVFNEDPILYEMGLIMGTSSSVIYNNVRGTNSSFNQDFTPYDRIRKITPGERSTSEVYGSFGTAASPSNSAFQVFYRSLTRKDSPYDKFVILEYRVKNTTTQSINGFRFGIFSDWDISASGAEDAAAWNAVQKIGYVFPKGTDELPHAGIQLLTGTANHFAIDNNQAIAGNPFGLYDGYTDAEKFSSLSESRQSAGQTTVEGNDVSHVVSAGPFSIAAGEEITIAFALHAANNLEELLESATHAYTLYNLAFQLAKPEVDVDPVCYGTPATLNASATGSSSFMWYTEFTGGESIASGSELTTANLFNDTTLYVANATDGYESVRTRVDVTLLAKPAVTTSGSLIFCEGQNVVLTVNEADEYQWSTGATTQSIEVSEAGLYTVTVRDVDEDCENTSEEIVIEVLELPVVEIAAEDETTFCEGLNVTITASESDSYVWSSGETTQSIAATESGVYTVTVRDNGTGCSNTSNEVTVNVIDTPDESFTTSTDIIVEEEISFFYNQAGDTSWEWDFGDGATSDQQNPTHTYDEIGPYTVTLLVTYENGCQRLFTKELSVVVSSPETLVAFPVSIHPNPANNNVTVQARISGNSASIELVNSQGKKLTTEKVSAVDHIVNHTLSLSNLAPGIYVVRVQEGDNTVIRRIVKQ